MKKPQRRFAIKGNNLSIPLISQKNLQKLYGICKPEDHLLILIEPDPDSIASALTLKRLLWKRVSKVVISYPGEIQRLENQAMVELLKIPLLKFNKINPDSFTLKALVDSQSHHQDIFAMYKYDVIIDHHPIVQKSKAQLIDIRPEYGATASIMTEYLRAAKIRPAERLATALLYGIKTDTSNFERDAIINDIEQFHYLYSFVNKNLLKKIERSEMRIRDLVLYRKALDDMTIDRKKVFAYLGEVKNPDICVQIADFFMSVHLISWSFIAGLYKKKLIVIIRSDGIRKDAGKLAAKAFGQYGSAGGHKVAARAEIPIDILRETVKKLNPEHIEGFIKERLGLHSK